MNTELIVLACYIGAPCALLVTVAAALNAIGNLWVARHSRRILGA